jgi:two-component system OmpR family response regulator
MSFRNVDVLCCRGGRGRPPDRPCAAVAAGPGDPPDVHENMLNCLAIEDDAETLRYVCNGLQAEGYAVTPCSTGVDGVRMALDGAWDIVILDRLLPGGVDGLTILHQLRERGKLTPVLILSALNSVDERVLGLQAGGDDYLSKPFAMAELLARVQNLVRRATSTRATTRLQVADLLLDLSTMRVSRGGSAIPLQPREYRLLEYLMRNEGQIVTRAMLLEAVWDYRFDPHTNVIDVQISRLRGKIDKDFEPALIHTVRGAGYTLKALRGDDDVAL